MAGRNFSEVSRAIAVLLPQKYAAKIYAIHRDLTWKSPEKAKATEPLNWFSLVIVVNDYFHEKYGVDFCQKKASYSVDDFST